MEQGSGASASLSCPHLQKLSKLIPKSVVGELKEDSSNVVQLIADAYNVSWDPGPQAPPGLRRAGWGFRGLTGDAEAWLQVQGVGWWCRGLAGGAGDWLWVQRDGWGCKGMAWGAEDWTWVHGLGV